MPPSENNRINKIPHEAIRRTVAGEPNAHAAGIVYAGVAKLYAMIDDDDTRRAASFDQLWIDLSFGDDMKQDKTWSSIIREIQSMTAHNREQYVAYIEQEHFTCLKDRYRPFAFLRREKRYRLEWNGHDDFDVIRIK